MDAKHVPGVPNHFTIDVGGLRGKSCPNCGSAGYYWLRSSGRCTDCGFHWGLGAPSQEHKIKRLKQALSSAKAQIDILHFAHGYPMRRRAMAQQDD